MKIVTCIAISVLAALALQINADTLEERIKPAGSLCMAGENCAAAPIQMASSDGPRSGEAVYSSKCATCHATGAAGAPKLDDTAAWQSRETNKGIETLYTNAIKGYNAMPAKGLCFDCSDDEIKASVDYILANSK